METNKTKIALAGYGVVGSQLLNYIRDHEPEIRVSYVIERNRHKRDLLKTLGTPAYEYVEDVPDDLVNQTAVVIDCSSKGQGEQNIESYRTLDLPAIFQNGELGLSSGLVYYPELANSLPIPAYVKMPICITQSAVKIVQAIKSHDIAHVGYIDVYGSKDDSIATMINRNHKGAEEELRILHGVESCLTAVSSRAEPLYGKFVYVNKIELEVDRAVNMEDLLRAIADTPLLELGDESLDTLYSQRTTNSVVIKEGVYQRKDTLHLLSLSYTPEVNFPLNCAAVYEHLGRKDLLRCLLKEEMKTATVTG